MRRILAIGLATAMGLVAIVHSPAASLSGFWSNSLRQIRLAILNYWDLNKHFPADRTDNQGNRILSWRVDLLLFVDNKPLYRQFRLNEAWDSAHNRELVHEIPSVFQNPYEDNSTAAYFTLARGPGTLIELGDMPKGRLRLAKSPRKILIVELGSAFAVPWSCPDSWQYDPANPQRGLSQSHRLGFFDRGTFVVCVDGHFGILAANTPDDTVRALFDPQADPPAATGYSSLELLWQPPYAVLTQPVIMFSAIVVLWSAWITCRLFRRMATSPGEILMVVLGARQLVFLIAYFAYFELPFMRLDNDPHHHVFHTWPALAAAVVSGLLACLAPARSGRGGGLILLCLILAISAVDGMGPQQRRSLEEALVDLSPFSLTVGGMAFLLLSKSETPAAGKPALVHWTAVALWLLPLIWFATWMALGYVPPREWFVRIIA